jgi:hypothetical protein
LPPEFRGRVFKETGFMTCQNDMGRNPLKQIYRGRRFIDVGKEIPVPGTETGKIIITRKEDGGLPEEEGEMSGGVSRGRDHIHGKVVQV